MNRILIILITIILNVNHGYAQSSIIKCEDYDAININEYTFSTKNICLEHLINIIGLDSINVKDNIESIDLLKRAPYTCRGGQGIIFIKLTKKINDGISEIVNGYNLGNEEKSYILQIIHNNKLLDDCSTRFNFIRKLKKREIKSINYEKSNNILKVIIKT